MKNIFKRQPKAEEKTRQSFAYTVFMKNGINYKCKGWATDRSALALHLSDAVDKWGNNFFTTEDGGKIVLWTGEIDCIKVDGEENE